VSVFAFRGGLGWEHSGPGKGGEEKGEGEIRVARLPEEQFLPIDQRPAVTYNTNPVVTLIGRSHYNL